MRPRPPSSGRPGPVRTRPLVPARTRLTPYRQLERGPGLPISARALLAVAILCLAGTVVLIGSGTLGRVVGALAGGVGGVVQNLASAVASSSPTPAAVIADVPVIAAPDNPYTNNETVDISVTVPQNAVGKAGYTVRLFDTLVDPAASSEAATVVGTLPVGPTSTLIFPGITLKAGTNDLQVALVGPDGEGGRSTTVTWVLDKVDPKITIVSPKDGASTTSDAVTIKGKTQPDSSVLLRDDANAATASVQADADGLFSVAIATTAGPNAITIEVTDPAGNTSSVVLHVKKPSGQLSDVLTASAYKWKVAQLPKRVTFIVTVTGTNGARLGGATALFTVTVPGLAPVVSPEVATSADGTAGFVMTIPAGATPDVPGGLVAVEVTAPSGTGTARQSLTITSQ